MKISKMKWLGYGAAIFAVALIAMTLLLGRSQKVVAAAAAAPSGIKNVVLVHGAFADGSGWDAVAKVLEKDGYTVSVAQPPETSYADDQKYTKAAIDAMGGPVVLVGHSYGGSIISEAGNDPNVAALVYVAAFALDEGLRPPKRKPAPNFILSENYAVAETTRTPALRPESPAIRTRNSASLRGRCSREERRQRR
jgi:pimeloyl-ACP methyl ester carboxylesterase